jgi:hypothetical protein
MAGTAITATIITAKTSITRTALTRCITYITSLLSSLWKCPEVAENF